MPIVWTSSCFLGCIYKVYYLVSIVFLVLKLLSIFNFEVEKKLYKLSKVSVSTVWAMYSTVLHPSPMVFLFGDPWSQWGFFTKYHSDFTNLEWSILEKLKLMLKYSRLANYCHGGFYKIVCSTLKLVVVVLKPSLVRTPWRGTWEL